jgi:hypothetical protein
MQKATWLLALPFLVLIALIIVLYLPQLTGYSISVLSNLSFMDKTTILLTFALAIFAAIEGFSTFKRAATEAKRHQIEDARNELEKAYGPLYMLLNKPSKADNSVLWLDFEERKKIDEIIATYPFMFPSQITEMWQQKIRNLASNLETPDIKSSNYGLNLDVYKELRDMINKEYNARVKNYRELLES